MKTKQLQQAIYDRLSGYTALTDLVQAVVSKLEPTTNASDVDAFPYVSIGTITANPFDTKINNGVNAVFQIDVWSRSTSELDRREIMDAVYVALHKHDLAIADCALIDCRYETSTEIDDPDGITTHGILLFRVMYEY